MCHTIQSCTQCDVSNRRMRSNIFRCSNASVSSFCVPIGVALVTISSKLCAKIQFSRSKSVCLFECL